MIEEMQTAKLPFEEVVLQAGKQVAKVDNKEPALP